MSGTKTTAPAGDNTAVEAKTDVAATATTAPAASPATEANNVVSHQNIIKKLIASGVKRINSIRVKNINFAEQDNYTRISFTLASAIKGFVRDEATDEYKEGTTSTLFTSLYAIAGAMKEDDNLGWMANALLERPQALNLILNGATIDVLQQEVKAGEEYVNPFSTRDDAEAQVYDHDVIINNIIGFKLSAVGQKMADKLADKMLGF